ncbi:MAG: hypothetical protein QGG40_09450 [Myxococcota bacterium]|nr:hypothetical protein [Myxococcota bacterium]
MPTEHRHEHGILRVGSIALLALVGCKTDTVEVTGVAADANNYSYEVEIDVPSIPTASATDLDICWDELASDIQCHDVDPAADIDNVSLIRFPHIDQTEVAAGLSGAGLQQADISGYVESRNEGETCSTLAEMSFFGTEIDVASEYTEDGGTYLLLLTAGTEPGVGALMLTFLEPSSSSDNTSVDVSDGCGVLDFEADLQSLEPMPLYADGPWEIDWSGLTVDGQALDIDLGTIDTITLGHYPDLGAADLEAQFLDLELLATTTWELEIESGSSVDLGDLTHEGEAFSGFDQDGLWVFALRCSRCPSPAPLFLTLIDPVTPEDG